MSWCIECQFSISHRADCPVCDYPNDALDNFKDMAERQVDTLHGQSGLFDEILATLAERDATIERLRGWLKSIEWVHMQGNGLHCGMCGRAKTLGHDPQCNWIEDAELLGGVR